MTRKVGQFDLYFNSKEQESLVGRFGTTDKKELKKLIKQYVLGSKTNQTQLHEDPTFQVKTLDDKLKKLKIADLRLKIWQKVKDNGFSLEQLKEIINGDDIPLPQKEDYTPTETTKPEPTKLQFKSLGSTIVHQPKQILQEDGTLRCKRCNRFFDMQGFDCMQLDDYRKHCEEVHGGLLQEERNELMEIYPN